MAGRREHRLRRTAFSDLPGVKNKHTIGKATEQSWIVCDEDHLAALLHSLDRINHSLKNEMIVEVVLR